MNATMKAMVLESPGGGLRLMQLPVPRPGDTSAQDFALRLGAAWAGGSLETPPEAFDAALIFAPVEELLPAALRAGRLEGAAVLTMRA